MLKRLMYRGYRRYSANRRWFRRRFTKAGIIVVVGTVISATLGADTNLSLSYQAFSLLSVMLIFSVAGIFISRPRFSAQRVLPRFGSAGSLIQYRILLRNETRRPQHGVSVIENLADPRPSLEDFLQTPEEGEEHRNAWDRAFGFYRWTWLISKKLLGLPAEQPVPICAPRGVTDVAMEIMPLRRGVMRFESLTVAIPDPLGLCRSLRGLPLPQSLLILPRRYFLPPLPLPGLMKYQQGGVALASSVGESEEFVSLRDYRPGDPLRHLHWKSWAKTGKPIVKEFQEEFFVRHALILDTFSARAHSDVFEEAVSVAASLACTIQTEESLLDLMFVGAQAFCFTAGRGLARTEQILEILASVEVCRERTFRELEDLVVQHAAGLSGCICVFIDWDEARQEFVRHLQIMGLPLLIFVVVPAGGQINPGPMFTDPENFRVLEAGRIVETINGAGRATSSTPK